MNKRKLLYAITCLLLISMFIACQKDSNADSTTTTTGSTTDTGTTTNISSHEEASDYVWDTTTMVNIVLKVTTIDVNGSGATASGSTVTITSAGTYYISGTLTNGQIVVNTSDDAVVRLIFNSITVANSTSAPVYIKKSAKTVIVLPANSSSTLSDATAYIYASSDDDEPNATIFSKSNLTIYGTGALNITSNFNDAIGSKDGLIIRNATIKLTSVDDGIRGKDYLIIHNANITATVKGDGLKSDNEDDTGAGYISILDGTITITSGGDAISAQNNVAITQGTFVLTAGGGSSATLASDASAKAIKGIGGVLIDGGTFTINAADDGIHTNKNMVINGGIFTISSGDDGMHADASLTINAGDITIKKSVEGIEGAAIIVNTGTINIVSSDDSFNASSGNGGETDDGSTLTINGGSIYVRPSIGDGLDSNGSITITGGTIIVHGPGAQPELGLDYNGTCNISGGFVIISGISSSMTQGFSTSSTQYSVKILFTSTVAANTLFHIQDADGNSIVTFKPANNYSSIVFSSADLKNGTTYSVYTGGSSTGTETNGYYVGGVYTPGTLYSTFTISSMVTSLGSSSSGGGGRGF